MAYLCAYQDVVSKQILGWRVMVTITKYLITNTLQHNF
jgi:putative transposase